MELLIQKNAPMKPYEKKWQFCVGSCHASTLLRADALNILKRVHDELGIKQVRFHGLFNDDMGLVCNFPQVLGIPVGDHIVETNFYKVGVLYDNILSLGMKPFVELSFMPQLLAKNPTRSFVYGSVPSMPKDMALWQKFIQDYLAYLFHRYGEEEVCSWYFEVWNEPDLSTHFFQDSRNGYLELYAATARAIKAFCPKLRVGGPATSASRWIDVIVKYCKENDVPLDFVSTHQYIGDPFMGVSAEEAAKSFEQLQAEQEVQKQQKEQALAKLKETFAAFPSDLPLLTALQRLFGGEDFTEQDFDKDIFAKNAAVVREQANGLPVFYTEWNLSANFASPNQDMRKVAAYDVRASLAIEDLVDGNSIWCFSDIFEELHQFKEPFHGGYGMVNYAGIPKPVFYAMRMLAQAGNQRIQLDETQFTQTEAARARCRSCCIALRRVRRRCRQRRCR
jgi:xylan 1,4-beta-xylosidase